jgi:hypothetical protein
MARQPKEDIMKPQDKELLAAILQYIISTEEAHYEETVETYGADGAEEHIYNLARTAWVVFEIDFS